MATVTVPPPIGKDSRRREAARRALVDVLWDGDGQRRVPSERALVAAIAACHPDDVWWVCEANSAGPLYLLPTREWMRALAKCIDAWHVGSVLEVAAGDGFLSAQLAAMRPSLTVRATDDHSWRRPERRIDDESRRIYEGVAFAGIRPGLHVEKRAASTAVKAHRPDLAIVSWAPPGRLVERVIRAAPNLVLDIGVDGDVCGDDERTWRYEKEFLDGPIEARALCRLDHGQCTERRTRVTLYYGAGHPLFVRPR